MTDAAWPSPRTFNPHTLAPQRGGRAARKRTRPKFNPTDKQVDKARERIVGYLARSGGSVVVPGGCNLKKLAQLVAPSLYNRGNQLGDLRKGEVGITVLAALQAMLCDGVLIIDDNYLALRQLPPAKKTHRQKYPPKRGTVSRVKRYAA